jgi:hypothetical protein
LRIGSPIDPIFETNLSVERAQEGSLLVPNNAESNGAGRASPTSDSSLRNAPQVGVVYDPAKTGATGVAADQIELGRS